MRNPASNKYQLMQNKKSMLSALARSIIRLNEAIGKVASYASLLLVVVICMDVLLRYVFSFTRIWVIEVETYLFSVIFLLGSPWTWKWDEHVRVDVLYSSFSPKAKRWTNLCGHILFTLPWTWIMMQVGWKFWYDSWRIGESSAQSGGLPALYLLKSLVGITFGLLFLQGLSHILLLFLHWNKEEQGWEH